MILGLKYQAVVTDVNDARQLGRIKARLRGFGDGLQYAVTPWSYPCSPLAGPGYGFFCLPQVGDEVWVEQASNGLWVWTGFFWSGRHEKPEAGEAPDVRVLRTPAGHQVKLDEAGDIEITHANGNVIALRQDGDIDVTVSGACNVTASGKVVVDGSNVELNGSLGDVVTTKHICAFTGGPHVLGSTTVKAGG
jgi:hypothetical protein